MLSKFPIVTTNSVEKAKVAISRSLTDVSIVSAADRNRFQLQMNGVNLGRTSLVFNRFKTDTKIKAGLQSNSVHFIIGGSAPTKVSLVKGSVVVSPHKAVMIMPTGLKQIERTEGSGVFVLRTSLSDLKHHFEKLTNRHHQGSLIFDHSIDLTNGPGGILKGIMNSLSHELGQNDFALKNPVLQRNYDDLLLTALLSLPHNKNEKLHEKRNYQVAPGLVHRSEEYMRANLKETISIIDLLEICGCSRSALFLAFQSSRGYTPMEFLTEQRLHNVRNRLLKQQIGASVTSIALECGFTHLGRFSQVYRRRFGESPSDTLQKVSL